MLLLRKDRRFLLSALVGWPVVCSLWSVVFGLWSVQDAFALLYMDITPIELYQRTQDETDIGYIILDIRSADEYKEAHIPGAVNISLKELGYRLYELDRTKDIIVYCNIGVQSKIACQVLANAGFKDVYNLTDGLQAWDYSLVTSYGTVCI